MNLEEPFYLVLMHHYIPAAHRTRFLGRAPPAMTEGAEGATAETEAIED